MYVHHSLWPSLTLTCHKVLEQINADVTLTSSRSDDTAIDVMRDFSKPLIYVLMFHSELMSRPGEAAGTAFQIRPAKDFIPAKGNDRLLSLSFLSELPIQCDDASSHLSSDAPSNAYEFMRKRRETNGDPTLKRWNANIRIGNFATLERTPLCVRYMRLDFLI